MASLLNPNTIQSWVEAGPTTLVLGAALVEGIVIRVLWKRMNDLENRQLEDLRKYAEDTRKREVATEGVLHRVADSMMALTEALKLDVHPEDVVTPRRRRRTLLDELKRDDEPA